MPPAASVRCVAHVLRDKVGVERNGGRRSLARRGDHLRPRVRGVPGGPHAGDARPPGVVHTDEAEIVELAAEAFEEAVEARADLGPDEEGGPLDDSTVA